jgi:hypothetical protein
MEFAFPLFNNGGATENDNTQYYLPERAQVPVRKSHRRLRKVGMTPEQRAKMWPHTDRLPSYIKKLPTSPPANCRGLAWRLNDS